MISPGAHSLISRSDVLWRRVLDGVLVRVIGAPDNTLIEGTGVIMWELLETPMRFDELCERLAEAHGVEPSTVVSDLGPVVAELGSRGVVSFD